MSNSNYVSNAPTTTQQHETLGPDGTDVTKTPDTEIAQIRKGQWEIYHDTGLPPFKAHSVKPNGDASNMCEPKHPLFLARPLSKNGEYPIADTVMGEGRWPEITAPGNSVVRSLVRTQVWQNNVLREQSKLKQ